MRQISVLAICHGRAVFCRDLLYLVGLSLLAFSMGHASVCAGDSGGAAKPDAKSSSRTDDTVATTIKTGQGPGWVALGGEDFVRVNGDDQTLVWDGTLAKGSGQPIGVTRSAKVYKNFELVIEWQHQRVAGNSGVFAWVDPSALQNLPPGNLPRSGIEIQMLDHGYVDQYLGRGGKRPLFFSTHGDVFPVGQSKMKPFPPLSPNGLRSFPSEQRSRGFGEWNHYYVRAINGEIRLWVNGVEVSGGTQCSPSRGYLCLESEGSPILFRNLRIRELP